MPVKIPGNISHAELAAEFPDGYTPPVKIHLQELLPGGRAGHYFRELRHWSQVTVTRTIGGKGRATISLANVNDQHFGFKAARKFRATNETSYRAYLRDLHKRTLPYVKEINPNRRRNNTLNYQGTRVFDDATIADYVGFLYNFDGFDGGLLQAGGSSDLVALGLFQRVIIDAQGPDGRWYALFTGLVSGIDDQYQAGEVPTINLICTDYWRLFELSEIIIKTGLDPIADNIQREFSTLLAQQLAFQATSLANLTGPKILQIVMDTVQRTMCWIPYALWKEGQITGQPATFPDGRTAGLPASPTTPFHLDPIPATISDENFFNHEPFWYIPFSDSGVEPAADYEGLSNLRRYARPPALNTAVDNAVAASAAQLAGQLVGATGASGAIGAATASLLPTLNSLVGTMTDGDEPKDGLPVGQLYATLLVDKYIQKGTQGLAYAQYISSILEPWQTNTTPGSVVVRRVADSTFYDVMITANGDLLYQIPKYNNCPAEYAVKAPTTPLTSSQQTTLNTALGNAVNPPDFATIAAQAAADALSPQLPTIIISGPRRETSVLPSGGQTYDTSGASIPDGEYDFSPLPEGFAQKNHGWNYVITNLGFRGWRFSSTEDGLYTTARVPAGQGLIVTPQVIETKFFTGRSRLEETQALVNRFGLRAFEAQKIFIDNLYGKKLSKELLDQFALALMNQLNGRTSTGILDLSFRPDLDEGKNVFVVERQRLLYVMGVTHTIRLGQNADASTSLQLAFGHDVSREIFSPFVAIRDLLTAAEDTVTIERNAQPVPEGSAASAGGVGNGTVAGPLVAPSSLGVVNAAPNLGIASPQNPFFIKTSGLSNGLAAFSAIWSRTAKTVLAPLSSPKAGDVANNDYYIDRPPLEMLSEVLAKLRQLPGEANATLTDDEYAVARAIASEGGSANVLEDILVVESKINALRYSDLGIAGRLRAHKSKDLRDKHYGSQKGRWAATSQDATYRGIVTVRAVFRGQVGPIVRGVTNYIGPKSQLANFKKYGKSHSPPPIELIEDWAKGRKLAWVGIVEGINDKPGGADRFIFLKPEPDPAKRKAATTACVAFLMANGYTRQL